MMYNVRILYGLWLLLVVVAVTGCVAPRSSGLAQDPLPSWNAGSAKRSLIEFVHAVTVETEFQIKDGKPALVRIPKLNFVDDKAGKPVGIYEHIGRRPILAFGNSDSDMQMIQYTKAGDGLRLGLIVHHTDTEREYTCAARATGERSTRFLIWPQPMTGSLWT